MLRILGGRVFRYLWNSHIPHLTAINLFLIYESQDGVTAYKGDPEVELYQIDNTL